MSRAAAFVLLGLSAASVHAEAQSSYQTLHQFKDNGAGINPTAGLTAGSQGELYGTTVEGGRHDNGYGTIFMLTPPAQGATQWGTKTIWILHGREGAEPQGRLLLGQDGALYGTASAGAYDHVLFGSVFRLAPPVGGGTKWTFTVLWRFDPNNVNRDGGIPDAPLIQDENGALYGTTTIAGGKQGDGFGTVFKLTPPAPGGTGNWMFERLASFGAARRDGSAPLGALYRDANGVLYGTTAAGGINDLGTVFSVTPPAAGETKWVKRDIIEFASPDATPAGGLVAGPDGDLYGTTSGLGSGHAGTIFQLIPPGNGSAAWTEQRIYQFNGVSGAMPLGALTPDGNGGFYGSALLGGDANNGTLFHIRPNANGSLPWRFDRLYDFTTKTGGTVDYQPNGDLVMDSAGALYGTTFLDSRFYAGSAFRFLP